MIKVWTWLGYLLNEINFIYQTRTVLLRFWKTENPGNQNNQNHYYMFKWFRISSKITNTGKRTDVSVRFFLTNHFSRFSVSNSELIN